MHKVIVGRDIDVPAEQVWEILDDFGAVHRYHPLVEKSPIVNGIASGLGAERACHFHNGDRVKERITAYEAGREYTVEIVDPGKFPLERAIARIAVTPIEDTRSRVRFEMSYQPKYGPIGWLMGATVMQSRFRRILASVLEGLEIHARTGEVVQHRTPLAAAA